MRPSVLVTSGWSLPAAGRRHLCSSLGGVTTTRPLAGGGYKCVSVPRGCKPHFRAGMRRPRGYGRLSHTAPSSSKPLPVGAPQKGSFWEGSRRSGGSTTLVSQPLGPEARPLFLAGSAGGSVTAAAVHPGGGWGLAAPTAPFTATATGRVLHRDKNSNTTRAVLTVVKRSVQWHLVHLQRPVRERLHHPRACTH